MDTPWNSRCPRAPSIASNTVQADWDTNSCFPLPLPKITCILPENTIPLINIWNGKRLTFPIVWLLWEAEQEEEPILFQPIQLLLDLRRAGMMSNVPMDDVSIQDQLLPRNGLIRS